MLVDELEVYDDELARQIDHDIADRAAQLAPWRIRELVRRTALLLDCDSAALRTAARTAGRRVQLQPDSDEQASVLLCGPAVPLVRWYRTLDGRARALRAAGDPRTLDAVRFDLATSTYPCTTHSPAEPAGTSDTTAQGDPGDDQPGEHSAAAGLRLSGVEAASTDCRRARPVQASIVVPVETALGLSNDPAWLDGYGWISAPSSRLLLADAELRRLCAQTSTGALVDRADHDLRPPPTPAGVRTACLDMIQDEVVLSDVGWRTEAQHDPSPALREFVTARDRSCDGPTQPRSPASGCQLDHTTPHPTGPTAAWYLAARNARTHQLKHYGWTPIRTPHTTIWTSPAGQVVDVPNHRQPPPGIDHDPTGPDPTVPPVTLPDPDQLAATDRHQLTPPVDGLTRPWLPPTEHPQPHTWTWLDNGTDGPAPF